MTRMLLRLLVLLALGSATAARGQELNLAAASEARPGIASVRTGMDHALVAEVGYRRLLSWGSQRLFLGGDAALPWAGLDLRDYRLRAMLGIPFGGERWQAAAWLSPVVRGTRNAASRMTAVGAEARLTGGYYAPRWFAAAEAGLDWSAATHIRFSGAYREVYAGARDGWYRSPGGTVYAGLLGGVSFSSVDLVVRAGHPRTLALEMQTVPFYLTLGANVALPW